MNGSFEIDEMMGCKMFDTIHFPVNKTELLLQSRVSYIASVDKIDVWPEINQMFIDRDDSSTKNVLHSFILPKMTYLVIFQVDFHQVLKPHVEGRAVTHQADIIQEVRRGSMKERWGLDLVYRMHPDTLSLELAVARVTCPSPAHVSGLRPGQVITLVNDWKIEAMQVPEAVQTVLMAGGFFMKLGWLNQTLNQITDEWKSLGKF